MTDEAVATEEVVITYRMKQIINHMLNSEPRTKHCASDIAKTLDMYSGTASHLMRRMAAAGWLATEQEDRTGKGGHPRIFYRFTPGSKTMLRKAIRGS